MHHRQRGVSIHMMGCVFTGIYSPFSNRTMTSTPHMLHHTTGRGNVRDQMVRRMSSGRTGTLPRPSVAARQKREKEVFRLLIYFDTTWWFLVCSESIRELLGFFLRG